MRKKKRRKGLHDSGRPTGVPVSEGVNDKRYYFGPAFGWCSEEQVNEYFSKWFSGWIQDNRIKYQAFLERELGENRFRYKSNVPRQ